MPLATVFRRGVTPLSLPTSQRWRSSSLFRRSCSGFRPCCVECCCTRASYSLTNARPVPHTQRRRRRLTHGVQEISICRRTCFHQQHSVLGPRYVASPMSRAPFSAFRCGLRCKRTSHEAKGWNVTTGSSTMPRLIQHPGLRSGQVHVAMGTPEAVMMDSYKGAVAAYRGR